MEVMDVEAADVKLNGIEAIALVDIAKGIKPVLEAKDWVPPLEYGMEVKPNIVVLGVMEGMEIIPPPCTDKGVFILVALMVEAMLLAVVIEGKY